MSLVTHTASKESPLFWHHVLKTDMMRQGYFPLKCSEIWATLIPRQSLFSYFQ